MAMPAPSPHPLQQAWPADEDRSAPPEGHLRIRCSSLLSRFVAEVPETHTVGEVSQHCVASSFSGRRHTDADVVSFKYGAGCDRLWRGWVLWQLRDWLFDHQDIPYEIDLALRGDYLEDDEAVLSELNIGNSVCTCHCWRCIPRRLDRLSSRAECALRADHAGLWVCGDVLPRPSVFINTDEGLPPVENMSRLDAVKALFHALANRR